ncbi:hypothetical protein VFPBJ_04252 [Purpureocillium lilacinum]|uniref:Uncharacterized protein n=1 Tax=Purpureocillium lilacinum TaxID=33203 RepID=A0A179GVZ7_PURLI|nr:hypothetical protein VFPBJ_04252 [Purpureocillium lilacinum]
MVDDNRASPFTVLPLRHGQGQPGEAVCCRRASRDAGPRVGDGPGQGWARRREEGAVCVCLLPWSLSHPPTILLCHGLATNVFCAGSACRDAMALVPRRSQPLAFSAVPLVCLTVSGARQRMAARRISRQGPMGDFLFWVFPQESHRIACLLVKKRLARLVGHQKQRDGPAFAECARRL